MNRTAGYSLTGGALPLSCPLVNGGAMSQPQMKMQNLPPMRCCMNNECLVFFFNSRTSLVCPGCSHLSDYFVDNIEFKVRYDGGSR